jgi:hypothetical protein
VPDYHQGPTPEDARVAAQGGLFTATGAAIGSQVVYETVLPYLILAL